MFLRSKSTDPHVVACDRREDAFVAEYKQTHRNNKFLRRMAALNTRIDLESKSAGIEAAMKMRPVPPSDSSVCESPPSYDSLFERRSSGKEHACLKAIYDVDGFEDVS